MMLFFYRQRALPENVLLKAIRDRQAHAIVTARGGFVIAIVACVGNDSNLLIVFYVQIMPDDFVMQLHR
ncbi:hypothetical protein WNL29_11530, partial [Enterobacter hormaechei subsp. xiangfangensis]